ncbi:flagellar motor switch protein FliM [bacterium]|nr:flagellar motor switch protein FliM [bacterium]
MPEVLSQDEIDALLNALSSGELKAEEIAAEANDKAVKVKPYDFMRPSKFSKEQIRTIHILHETFGRLWSGKLSAVLRNFVSISVSSVDQVTYQEFMLSIPNPTIISAFNLEPLEGKAVLEFSPTLGLPIIDRLLGGSGEGGSNDRELTEIETHVIRNLLDDCMDFLREAWASMIDLQPSLKDIESNPLFVQIVPPNDMILLISLEARIGNLSGIINIVYPYVLLEPILSLLSAQTLYAVATRGSSREAREKTSGILQAVGLPMSVELGVAQLTFREILALEPGDVIILETAVNEELRVRVEGLEKFLCRPGLVGKHRGAQITQVLEEPDQVLHPAVRRKH